MTTRAFSILVAAWLACMATAFVAPKVPVSSTVVTRPSLVLLRAEGGETPSSSAASSSDDTTTTSTTSSSMPNGEGQATEVVKAVVSADGTYYDDEIEPVEKVGISNSMRERLMREASTGLDADKKQTNVLLYIILGVAALVIVGGGGILY